MIAVIDDLGARSSNCDTLKIAPNRHYPRHAELCCFRRGHVAIGGAFESAWDPRRRRLDVLHARGTPVAEVRREYFIEANQTIRPRGDRFHEFHAAGIAQGEEHLPFGDP